MAHAHFAAALLAESEGRAEEAFGHFREAALLDPGNETLVLQVAGRMMQSRRLDEAVGLLRDAIHGLPRAPASYHAWMGIAYLQMGRVDDAIEANEAALRVEPGFLLACQNLVALHSEAGRGPEALRWARVAASSRPEDAFELLEAARLFERIIRLHPEQADEARDSMQLLLDRVADLQPDNPSLLYRLAEGYERLGNLERAQAVMEELVMGSPELPMAREGLVNLYLRSNDREAAERQLRALVAQRPEDVQVLHALGSLLLQGGRPDEAESFLRRAILLQPLLEPGYYELAAARLSQGNGEQALQVLGQARSLFRTTFLLEFYTALACVQTEKLEEALQHFSAAESQAIASEPARLNALFYFQYGAASERTGHIAAAEVHLRKSLELDPESAETLNYLGYMWADRGENLTEARVLLEKALELDPENAAVQDSMGWLLFRLGDHAEALEWIERAISGIEEPDPVLYDHLGDVLHELGRADDASKAWERSLELKEDEKVRRKLGEPLIQQP